MRHCLFILLLITGLLAQGQNKYWILFIDKPERDGIQPALSEAAMERRAQQGIALDERDFPVSKAYLSQLSKMGIAVQQCSRWLNAASAHLSPEQCRNVCVYPWVKGLYPVAVGAAAQHRMRPQGGSGYLATPT